LNPEQRESDPGAERQKQRLEQTNGIIAQRDEREDQGRGDRASDAIEPEQQFRLAYRGSSEAAC